MGGGGGGVGGGGGGVGGGGGAGWGGGGGGAGGFGAEGPLVDRFKAADDAVRRCNREVAAAKGVAERAAAAAAAAHEALAVASAGLAAAEAEAKALQLELGGAEAKMAAQVLSDPHQGWGGVHARGKGAGARTSPIPWGGWW